MKPQAGDTVRVHYRGTLSDGSEFDSSAGRDPLMFTLGEESVIPGFESAVADLEVGASTTVVIPSADAYGERVEDAIQSVPRSMFGEMVPEVGLMIGLQNEDGQHASAVIADMFDDTVLLDFNHPLAGKDLTFELTLVEIIGQ